MQRQQEDRQHHNAPRDAKGETSQAKEKNPYKPPGENRNEERRGRENRGDGPIPY